MREIEIIVTTISWFIRLLSYSILAEVILSYIPSVRGNKFYEIILKFNEPVLTPFKQLQNKIVGESMLDFSPVFAIIFLDILNGLLLSLF